MTLIDLESNMANIKGDAGVEVIPNAAVEVITRMRRGARFTTYVPKMLK